LPVDNSLDAVKRLVVKGADIRAADHYLLVPMLLADKKYKGIIKFLISKGARLHARTADVNDGPSMPI